MYIYMYMYVCICICISTCYTQDRPLPPTDRGVDRGRKTGNEIGRLL